MDSQSTPQPGFTKPIGGFIVVLCVALIIGGWLYVDMIKNELEMKVDAVSSELEAAKLAAKKAAEARKMEPPAVESDLQTYAAELGGYRFQVDLPRGWHLSFGDGAMGEASAYVVMDSTPENETPPPDLVINLVNLENESYASRLGKEESGTRLVVTTDGKFAFWIRGWEDQEWRESSKVLASFKAL